MKKAVITFGLPGSGKSTWAQKHYPSSVIVSADEIKKTLPGYTDEKHADFYKEAVKIAKEEILGRANDGHLLIVFDTGSINSNYSRDLIKELYYDRYSIELVIFTTPLAECINRDRNRPQSVGEDVIIEKEKKAPEALWAILPFISKVDLIDERGYFHD